MSEFGSIHPSRAAALDQIRTLCQQHNFNAVVLFFEDDPDETNTDLAIEGSVFFDFSAAVKLPAQTNVERFAVLTGTARRGSDLMIEALVSQLPPDQRRAATTECIQATESIINSYRYDDERLIHSRVVTPCRPSGGRRDD